MAHLCLVVRNERTRLAMIKLLLEPVNLLILDEPTNHLDMKTKDILKQALMDFDGTLIVVSHDRDFLDGLVTKVYEFGNKKVKEHLCGIYEFLETVLLPYWERLYKSGWSIINNLILYFYEKDYLAFIVSGFYVYFMWA